MSASLPDLLKSLSRLRVAVVGDVMLDRFVFGRADRISPEAPVPVVHVGDEQERLGGAANVAANVVALGATTRLCGVIGAGEVARQLGGALAAAGLDGEGLLECPERVTTVKTRILAGQQQIVRIDRETRGPLATDTRARLHARLREMGPFDAVIVSDYGKGVVDEELMRLLRGWHDEGCVVVVDPKQGNFDLYRGTSCITPNEREAAGACHETIAGDADAERVGRMLRERLETDWILVTRGEHGMTLLGRDGAVTHLPTEARHVYDVTGAGDTVIASFTALLAAGADPVLAARAANVAAGLTVRELGTAVASAEALREAWERRGDGRA